MALSDVSRACGALLLCLLAACSDSRSEQATESPPPITAPPSTPPPPSQQLELTESATAYTIGDGATRLVVARAGLQTRWTLAEGATIVESTAPGSADPARNRDYERNNDVQDGIDRAYPGLPDISYQPYAYRTAAGWQTLTQVTSARLDGRSVVLTAQTSDGLGAELRFRFAGDGALELRFAPNADGVEGTEVAWDSPEAQRYYGGGQRFSGFELRGTSLPLWISHGPFSNRETSTNEIAASFFWCPCGWGAWGVSDARGEINFANPAERTDAVNLMQETSALEVVLYRGTPREIVSAHTARAGRPQWTPPDWMWRPLVWNDSDPTTESTRALVDGMLERDIPLGAVWLDNPWDAGYGSFDFDPSRFPEPDALIREVHDKGVRFMVWLSPFVTGYYDTYARDRNWVVTGTRNDGNDATYYPVRGIAPHLDFTHPDAYAWWRDGLRALIRRGVDGVKVDRGEEDLSDDSVWYNGLHNRLNHNAYIDRYHRAIFEAFDAERPGGDFVILARGGWNGSGRWAGHWAADNLSFLGELGLTQALRSLLSLSVSGFPFSGADIGGYVGIRQDLGEAVGGIPLLPPGEGTYIRWAQLGALSPVMQTPVPPWWVSERAVAVYRTYAVLHDRLVPYIAQAAREYIETGVPVVRPMPYEYPEEPLALEHDDQYLFGPDLLVAPLTDALSVLPLPRRVFIPAGRWTSFWTGASYDGPTVTTVVVPLEQIPLFVRDGAQLPEGVSADALP